MQNEQYQAIRSSIYTIDDATITAILKDAHCDKSITIDSIPNLLKFVDELRYQCTILRSILNGGTRGKSDAKKLNVACLLAGEEEAGKIFARFIYVAQDEKQLTNFLAFALTLIHHYPSLMTLAVTYLIKNFSQLEDDLRVYDFLGNKSETLANTRFIINLATIIQWQQCSNDDGVLKYLGLSLSDLRGELQTGLMDWVISYVEKIRPILNGKLDEAHGEVLNNFTFLMKVAAPTVQLRLKHLNKLINQIGAFIASLLMFVNKDSPIDGVDTISRFYSVIGNFFTHVTGASKDLLACAICNEVIENSHEIFGTPSTSIPNSHLLNVHPTFDGIPTDLLAGKACDSSVLSQLLQMPIEIKSASAMAHSGTLKRKKAIPIQPKITSSHELRRMLFVYFIDILCMDGPDGKPDVEMCRVIGQHFVDRFCGDGFTSCLSTWQNWEEERDMAPRYLKIDGYLDSFVFLFDFLLIFSRLGPRGLCFALPLIKGRFASLLSQLETTPHKTEQLTSTNLLKCSHLFALFISGKFYPNLFETLYEIISKVTNHEAYVLLMDLWNFLESLISNQFLHFDSIESLNDPFLLEKDQGSLFISSIVLIIQRNITVLGHCLPKIMNDNNIKECSEDDWTIERVPPAISTGPNIKR